MDIRKIDEISFKNNCQLYLSGDINSFEEGTTKGLQQIHAYLFKDLYKFAEKSAIKTSPKAVFASPIA